MLSLSLQHQMKVLDNSKEISKLDDLEKAAVTRQKFESDPYLYSIHPKLIVTPDYEVRANEKGQ